MKFSHSKIVSLPPLLVAGKSSIKNERGPSRKGKNDDTLISRNGKFDFSLPQNKLPDILTSVNFIFMQLLSKLPFKTQKSIPSGSDNRGTGLLLQAGMIRMTLA